LSRVSNRRIVQENRSRAESWAKGRMTPHRHIKSDKLSG
jgi:hypothetical protein